LGTEWDCLRATLAQMARRRDLRINEWSERCPSEWMPTQVLNPETDMPYSDSSAWLLIAELLESDNCPFREVSLRKPPGALGYEALIPSHKNTPPLYIKIQLMSGRILGRSFHYSTKSCEESHGQVQ
jgi:hypothetical protein